MFAWKLVTFDIDGTLTRGHGWEHVAEGLGRRNAYDTTQREFQAHRVGEDEHLSDLLALAEGCSVAEFERLLETTPKVGGIEETIVALHERGARVALLTHNPGYVCRWYLRRYGFDDFEGAIAPEVTDGVIPAAGRVRAEKVTSLHRLLARLGDPADQTIHVGDSYADAAVFPLVGGGIAINSAIASVRAAADATADVEDLRELLPLLDCLGLRSSPT